MTEPRPPSESFEYAVEAGSRGVHTQPSALEHALESFPIANRDEVRLLLHAGADTFDEDVETHRRVAPPAPCEAVVEEDVHDDPGVASAGSGDIGHAGPERVMAIRESIDGAVQCHAGHDPRWRGARDPALDEVGTHVAGANRVVFGGQQRVGEEVHCGAPAGDPIPDRPRYTAPAASRFRLPPPVYSDLMVRRSVGARRMATRREVRDPCERDRVEASHRARTAQWST